LVELELAVKQRIERLTAGRIHGLEVVVTADRVEIHGQAAAFYLKQLAIQGVLEEVGSWDNSRQVVIAVQIEVPPAGSDATTSE
jgi:hypothetical protein